MLRLRCIQTLQRRKRRGNVVTTFKLRNGNAITYDSVVTATVLIAICLDKKDTRCKKRVGFNTFTLIFVFVGSLLRQKSLLLYENI